MSSGMGGYDFEHQMYDTLVALTLNMVSKILHTEQKMIAIHYLLFSFWWMKKLKKKLQKLFMHASKNRSEIPNTFLSFQNTPNSRIFYYHCQLDGFVHMPHQLSNFSSFGLLIDVQHAAENQHLRQVQGWMYSGR